MARGDSVILDSSYGFSDLAKSVRVTAETRFDVASVSKGFTAAAVLILRDEGRLSLSAPLAEFFDAVPPDKAGITVYQLLSHTSGLSDTYPASGIADRGEAVRRVLLQPLIAAPGTGFNYSDDNYVLLAALIEARSGETFEDFLRRRLFVPSGMTHTTFWGQLDFEDPSKLAALQRQLPPSHLQRNWGELGAGGVLSTALDLYRWWTALTGNSVLSQHSVADLLAAREHLSSGTEIAFGWFRSASRFSGQDIWSRGNEDWGHNAILYAIPSRGYVMAVTSNSGSVGDEPWSRRVRDGIESLLADQDAVGSVRSR